MASKFVLVPEDVYKGLLQVEPESIALDHEKKEIFKTKKNPKPISTKNTLYNQKLRRLLKINR